MNNPGDPNQQNAAQAKQILEEIAKYLPPTSRIVAPAGGSTLHGIPVARAGRDPLLYPVPLDTPSPAMLVLQACGGVSGNRGGHAGRGRPGHDTSVCLCHHGRTRRWMRLVPQLLPPRPAGDPGLGPALLPDRTRATQRHSLEIVHDRAARRHVVPADARPSTPVLSQLACAAFDASPPGQILRL